jgi:hypothetical protein
VPYKDPKVRKERHKEYSRSHYARNKAAVIAASKTQRISFAKRWEEYKSQQVCINCGFSHPAAIDFHHVKRHPSNRKLYQLIKNRTFSRALEEVKKCVPLCANCHRVHHYEEHKAKKQSRKQAKPPVQPRKSRQKPQP